MALRDRGTHLVAQPFDRTEVLRLLTITRGQASAASEGERWQLVDDARRELMLIKAASMPTSVAPLAPSGAARSADQCFELRRRWHVTLDEVVAAASRSFCAPLRAEAA